MFVGGAGGGVGSLGGGGAGSFETGSVETGSTGAGGSKIKGAGVTYADTGQVGYTFPVFQKTGNPPRVV
jgi:hypothetical protein